MKKWRNLCLEVKKADSRTIEEFMELLRTKGLSVILRQPRKDLKEIQVNCANPKETRSQLAVSIGPELGIQFQNIRKTKKDGYALAIVQTNVPETYIVRIKKGGDFRPGRANELGLQDFIRSHVKENGICKLNISDNYGTRVKLNIVEVMDAADNHGDKGKANRSDTIVKLKDGSIYGISQKQENASIICSAKKMFGDIIWHCGRALREYAKEHGMKKGDYMDIQITNRELIDLCWFGTDIKMNGNLSGGAVFMGNFQNMDSGKQKIERIVETGNDEFLSSFPIYTKWLICNNQYTMEFKGVYCKNCKWIIDDIVLPGVNAPLPNGKAFKTGKEDKQKKTRRRRKTKKKTSRVKESSPEMWMCLERTEDMWDTIAWCAENHKMVWLKYETVDGERISRRVAPYSYRTRRTKVRGKATYFYGQDFTPGEDSTIKCFLVDNCLQAKKSPTSFSPRFTVEIKQEIDRLEDQRRKEEQEKEREEQKMKVRSQDREKEQNAKQKTHDDMENYMNTLPEKPKLNKDDGQNKKETEQQKKVDVVKVSEKPDRPQKPEQKEPPPPPPPPPPVEVHGNEEDDGKVQVTNEPEETASKPDTGEVQVTDNNGKPLNENWIRLDF